MTHHTDQERAEFEAWSQANNKYHVSGYNPHNDLWEAWQAARRAQVVLVPQGMEQDAARYQALVESGNFAPSPFDNGMWGLRVSRVPSTKAELDAAVDRVIEAQAKQGGV